MRLEAAGVIPIRMQLHDPGLTAEKTMNKKFASLLIVFCCCPLFGPAENLVAQGPGTEMTRIINRIGLGSDCQRCKSLADQMDRNGADWVTANFDHVVQRTVANAANLGHRMGPVRRTGVRLIVRRSVRLSRFGR